MASEGIHTDGAERGQSLDGVFESPGFEQGFVWVDAHAEAAVPLPRRPEFLPKGAIRVSVARVVHGPYSPFPIESSAAVLAAT